MARCCSSRSPCCGEQCRLQSFTLSSPHRERFGTAAWPCISPVLYIVYRILVMLYFLVWIIYSGWPYSTTYLYPGERAKWFIYITNLGFAVLNLHLIHAFIVSVIVYKSSVRTANVQEADSMASAPSLPCYLKSDWFLFNLACNIAFTLTVCYWALLFNGQTDGVDINTHAINSVYVIVDVIVSATPVRLLHMWIAQLGALVYVVFTAIYWAAGGTGAHGVAYIYSVLDYGNAPGQAVITAAVIVLLVVPIAQVALFLLSAARGSLVDHCFIATRDKQPIIEDVVMTTNL